MTFGIAFAMLELRIITSYMPQNKYRKDLNPVYKSIPYILAINDTEHQHIICPIVA